MMLAKIRLSRAVFLLVCYNTAVLAKLITLTLNLQVISLAGWVNIMYYIQDAHSFWDWIYFVALIVVWILFH